MNVPIAVSLGIAAVAAMLAGRASTLPNVAITMYQGATSFPLIAIPLFILAGAIMNTSGISRRLIASPRRCSASSAARWRMVNVGLDVLRRDLRLGGGRRGRAGSILIPAMKKRGYPAAFSAAVTSSSASLAIIIPPSIPMILYAVMAGTSVVQLFVAGIVPGVHRRLLDDGAVLLDTRCATTGRSRRCSSSPSSGAPSRTRSGR
jgi:C4-dicarboxylate transporter, DctM subunit